MAQKQRKFNRLIPLLLALVVLIGCIPPIQASAASSLTLSGCWRIKSGWEQAADDGFFSDFSVNASFYVYVDGVYHSCYSLDFDMRMDIGVLFVGSSTLSDVFQAFKTSGSHGVDGGYLYFTSPVTITDADAIEFFRNYAEQSQLYTLSFDDRQVDHAHGYAWDAYLRFSSSSVSFECEQCDWSYNYVYSGLGSLNGFTINGVLYNSSGHVPIDGSSVYVYPSVTEPDPDPGTTYSSIITIDGQEFTFTSTTEQPAVSLQVTTTGAILNYNGQSQIYVYNGDGKFLGLSFASIYDPAYTPGNSYLLASGRATLFSVNDGTSSGVSVYETTIVIDGSVYQFFSEESYPLVTCFLSSEGVQLVCGDDNRWWRPDYNQEFLGLCLRPNSSEPDFSLYDEYFVVRGSSEEVAFQFYSFCVESEDNSWSLIFRRSAEIFLIPVAVFFTFEFLPGISIGSVMIISLVLGILFFFLKSSK